MLLEEFEPSPAVIEPTDKTVARKLESTSC